MPPKRRKKRLPRPPIKTVNRKRHYGGATGSKPLSAGTHVTAKGIRTDSAGQKLRVYDEAHILKAPISIEAAHALIKPWLAAYVKRATKYIKQDPIIHVGAIAINRGRMFQPWVFQEHFGRRSDEAAQQVVDLLLTYVKFAAVATTRATRKTGVIGWFARGRGLPYGPIQPPKKRPKRKQKKNAHSKTSRKARKKSTTLSRVGRRKSTPVRRRANQHKVVGRGSVRRKRKAKR